MKTKKIILALSMVTSSLLSAGTFEIVNNEKEIKITDKQVLIINELKRIKSIANQGHKKLTLDRLISRFTKAEVEKEMIKLRMMKAPVIVTEEKEVEPIFKTDKTSILSPLKNTSNNSSLAFEKKVKENKKTEPKQKEKDIKYFLKTLDIVSKIDSIQKNYMNRKISEGINIVEKKYSKIIVNKDEKLLAKEVIVNDLKEKVAILERKIKSLTDKNFSELENQEYVIENIILLSVVKIGSHYKAKISHNGEVIKINEKTALGKLKIIKIFTDKIIIKDSLEKTHIILKEVKKQRVSKENSTDKE